MKKGNFLLLSSFTLLLLIIGIAHRATLTYKGTINPLIGDISFIEKFGYTPDENTDDKVRIQTHLEYVEQLLRAKNISDLSVEQRQQRYKLLDALHQYAIAGRFPMNYDKAERRPCFIDRDGNICAVGYLLEVSEGREAAVAVNTLHQYDYIGDMDARLLTSWAQKCGLTLEEFAMMQPTYAPPVQNTPQRTNREEIKGYTVATGLMMGANLSLSTFNIIQTALTK